MGSFSWLAPAVITSEAADKDETTHKRKDMLSKYQLASYLAAPAEQHPLQSQSRGFHLQLKAVEFSDLPKAEGHEMHS